MARGKHRSQGSGPQILWTVVGGVVLEDDLRSQTGNNGRKTKAIHGLGGPNKRFVLNVGVQWQLVERWRMDSHDWSCVRGKLNIRILYKDYTGPGAGDEARKGRLLLYLSMR